MVNEIYKTNKIQYANFQELVHKPAVHVMSTNIYLIIAFRSKSTWIQKHCSMVVFDSMQ